MSVSKVLIVDDHEVVIQGIRSLLKELPQYTVVGVARDGLQAVELARRHEPHMVIMDISMPEMDGIEATVQIKDSAPDTRVVIYTMHSESEWVLELFKAGISAYVLKDGPVTDLLLALKAVESGGTYFSSVAPSTVASHLMEADNNGLSGDVASLSTREMEVFKLLADGTSIKYIADALFISPRTVETHKYNIMKKLNVSNMTELTKIAIKKKIIDI